MISYVLLGWWKLHVREVLGNTVKIVKKKKNVEVIMMLPSDTAGVAPIHAFIQVDCVRATSQLHLDIGFWMRGRRIRLDYGKGWPRGEVKFCFRSLSLRSGATQDT